MVELERDLPVAVEEGLDVRREDRERMAREHHVVGARIELGQNGSTSA